jgi:hypothetical protein
MCILKTKTVFGAILLFISAGMGLGASAWYAAPNATAGNGSKTNPWPLFVALTRTNIQPGDTLYLRNGTYVGPGFVSTLSGTSNNPVTVRSNPGEWAKLTDGTEGVLQTTMDNVSTGWQNIVITGLESLNVMPPIFVGEENLYVGSVTSKTNFSVIRGWGATSITNHAIGDRVVLHATYLNDLGNYVHWQDFEIVGTATNRVLTGSNWMGGGFNMGAQNQGTKLINLVIHNTGHPGIGAALQVHDVDSYEINGCLVFGTGVYYSWNGNQVVGSGMYLENQGKDAIVKNCILFRNFTSNAKFFGEGGDVHNQRFLTNISFLGGLNPMQISSGSKPSSNTWMNGNIMMGTPSLSYVSVSNQFQYFINNTVVNGSFGVTETYNSVYTNNTAFTRTNIYGAGGDPFNYQTHLIARTNLNMMWDYNTYYIGTNSSPYDFYFACLDVTNTHNSQGGGYQVFGHDIPAEIGFSWLDWSATNSITGGFDTHSTYQEGWPTNYLKVSVQQYDYDSNRWNIAVVSTSAQTNTTIALSDYGFATGDGYQLVDAQNWPAVVASGKYASGTISLPLNLTNVSAIPGVTHFTNEHTNVKNPGLFNAFVLRRIPRPTPPTGLAVVPASQLAQQ